MGDLKSSGRSWKGVAVDEWPDDQLVFEVASLTGEASYLFMSEDERRKIGMPDSPDSRRAFILAP